MIKLIIAYPVFKLIAKDIERFCRSRRVGQKAQEECVDVRTRLTEMHVGDE